MSEAEGQHTFVFADIAGFTALTEAHGDLAAADLACEFAEAVKAELPDYDGEFVKTIGDAIMLRFGSPLQGVRLSLRLVEDLMTDHGSPAVRVGVHRGPAVERDGDWFGSAVNLAARISAQAGGGEVLVSSPVGDELSDADELELRSRGAPRLRNVTEPVELFVVTRAGRRTGADLVLDPVCRMALDPDQAAGTLNHGGTTYHFCSLECAQKFAARPEAYTSPQ